MMNWSFVDGVILVILVLSVFTGLIRGFVKELVSLCIWVLAIWAGYTYCREVAVWFKSYIHEETAQVVCGFLVIMFGTIIVGSLVNALFSFILRSTGLTGTDRLLGMGFGLVRGVIIVSLLILAVKITLPTFSSEYAQKSLLYTKFNPVVDWLYGFSPEFIQKMQVLDNLGGAPHHVIQKAEPAS